MKKIFMGIVWFLLIQFILGVVGGCMSVYIQRSMGIPKESIGTPHGIIFLILTVSLVLAIWGTATGKLPGTKIK